MSRFDGVRRAPGGLALLLVVLVGALGTAVQAQVIPVGPPEALATAHQRTQTAIIDVRRDGRVQVDLSLSFSDETREPGELALILPLQTVPDRVEMNGMAVGQFQKKFLRDFDRLYYRAMFDEVRQDAAFQSSLGLASVMAGPVAAALAPPVSYRRRRHYYSDYGGTAATLPPVEAAVRMAEGEVEVYDGLTPGAGARLPGIADIDASGNTALSAYTGRPFALVKLRTIPFDPPRRQESDPARSPGVHLRFEQRLVEREGALRYDYPLDANAAWKGEAPVTQVYVTAPEGVDLTVDFPHRPATSDLRGYLENMAYLDESAGWSADGRQVYEARYDRDSPAESIRIRLGKGDESAFQAARRADGVRLRVLRWALVLLGGLLWTGAFALVVRTDPHARSLGFGKALGKSWIFTSGLLLGPVTLFYWARWAVYRRSLFHLIADNEVTEAHIAAGGVLFAALLLIAAAIAISRRARARGYRSFLLRGTIAAVISGAAYVPLGRALIGWLSG